MNNFKVKHAAMLGLAAILGLAVAWWFLSHGESGPDAVSPPPVASAGVDRPAGAAAIPSVGGAREPLAEVASAAAIQNGLRRSPPGYIPAANLDSKRIELGAELLLHGRVIAKGSGRHLEAATVKLYPPRTGPDEPSPLVIENTDENGRYEIHLDVPIDIHLTVEKTGYAGAAEWLSLQAPGRRELNFELRPAPHRLEGRVADTQGRGLAGAKVTLSFPQTYSPVRQTQTLIRETSTDSGGRFGFVGVPSGEILVTALQRGFAPGFEERTLEGTAGRTERVDFRLQSVPVFSVLVQNLRGEPIPEAKVQTDLGGWFAADARGRVKFQAPADVGDRFFPARVSAEGYLAQTIQIDPAAPPSTVVLSDGRPLEGRVVSESGEPVADAALTVWSGAGGPGGRGTDTVALRTDRQGTFSTRLASSPLNWLWVSHPDFIDEKLEFSRDPGDRVEIRLKRPEGGVFGRVLDAAGQPVKVFKVSMFPLGGRGSIHRTFESAEGRFSILDLRAGLYRLAVSGLGEQETSRAVMEPVEVIKGQVFGELALVLPAPEPPSPGDSQ